MYVYFLVWMSNIIAQYDNNILHDLRYLRWVNDEKNLSTEKNLSNDTRREDSFVANSFFIDFIRKFKRNF